MIPKIIHYTWFSGDEYPENIRKCIDSWHKILPDYELRLWDMNAIKDIDSKFLKEAIQMKKWAYAADMVRCYAVYHYGGIYLDTDVEVFKSFDEFLNCKAFIGQENSIHRPIIRGRIYSFFLSSHCFGAEKGHIFVKDCLDYYYERNFILSTNPRQPEYFRFNMVLMPFVQCEIALQYGYDPNPFHHNIQNLKDGLTIYPTNYFDPYKIKKESVCKHWAVGGWVSKGDARFPKKNNFFYTGVIWVSQKVLSIFKILAHTVYAS